MTAKQAWDAIPEARRGELSRFIIHGLRPGHAMWLLLSEQTFLAATYADTPTVLAIGPILKFLVTYAPMNTYGSGLALETWIGLGQKRRTAICREAFGYDAFEAMLADSGIMADA